MVKGVLKADAMIVTGVQIDRGKHPSTSATIRFIDSKSGATIATRNTHIHSPEYEKRMQEFMDEIEGMLAQELLNDVELSDTGTGPSAGIGELFKANEDDVPSI